MKTIFFTFTIVILSFDLCFSQSNKIVGILNTEKTDINFTKGQVAIKSSIQNNIQNLNLYEYAHSLNELYSLLYSGELKKEKWVEYVNTLDDDVTHYKCDTIPPFYAIDYKGLIPLQAEFFISSLDKNIDLQNKYPMIYEFLKESTNKLIGKGYDWEDIMELLVCFPRNSTVGTVNFWLFVQLYGCSIIELAIQREGIERVKMLLSNLHKTSTYKTPINLQLRKYRTMKINISSCLESYGLELKGTTSKYDSDLDFFDPSKNEGYDNNMLKEF